MKRLIVVSLILTLLLTFCACGEVPSVPDSTQNAPSEDNEAAVSVDEMSVPNPTYEPVPSLVPVSKPAVEVEITEDIFFDYFEYIEFPEYNIHKETDTTGKLSRIIAEAGFFLKKEYVVAEEHTDECFIEVRVKYMRNGYRSLSKAIEIDLDNCSYNLLHSTDYYDSNIHDETVEGTYLDDIHSYYIYIGSDNVLNATTARLIMQKSIELVSASGKLYLSE